MMEREIFFPQEHTEIMQSGTNAAFRKRRRPGQVCLTFNLLCAKWPDALKNFYEWGRGARARGSPTFAIDPNAKKSSVTESDEPFELKPYRSPLLDQRKKLFYHQIVEQRSLLDEKGSVVGSFIQFSTTFLLMHRTGYELV